MSREKQIEEMARIITKTCENRRVIGSANIAEELYNKGYQKQEWISVEERLPTDQKSVLCYYGFDRGDDDLGMMFVGVLCYFCFDKNPHWQHAEHNLVVTHWMPLPEPPKMKGE